MYLFDSKLNVDRTDAVVKNFFNTIYSCNIFVKALRSVVNKNGCVVNEDYCIFPDMNDPDVSSHFVGVMFGTCGEDVIVTESEFWRYVKMACENYVFLHPEDAGRVQAVLEKQF